MRKNHNFNYLVEDGEYDSPRSQPNCEMLANYISPQSLIYYQTRILAILAIQEIIHVQCIAIFGYSSLANSFSKFL